MGIGKSKETPEEKERRERERDVRVIERKTYLANQYKLLDLLKKKIDNPDYVVENQDMVLLREVVENITKEMYYMCKIRGWRNQLVDLQNKTPADKMIYEFVQDIVLRNM